MRRLIVNADDLGLDRPRNQGILVAAELGLVTSVSLLANGDAFEHALGLVRCRARWLGVGVHLNLSEGRPLARGVDTLVGEGGCFPGKTEARRRLAAGEVDSGELTREVSAQVNRVLQAGLSVSHLDGHQHVHVFGALLETVAPALRERGIHRVRIPEDAGETPLSRELRPLCQTLRSRLPELGLRTTDHFCGLACMGTGQPRDLWESICRFPEGSLELMVHPGFASQQSVPFSSSRRERELRVLLHPWLRKQVQAHPDLEPVSWAAL